MKAPSADSPYITLRVALCASIFLLAFGVRLLTWHDTRLEVGKVQTVVSQNYKLVGQLLRQDGLRGFFSSSSPLADLNHLGHPPGYSILIALTHAVFGESDTAVQFEQIFFDALSAVVIFLIVGELFPSGPAVIVGMLAALSPQLAWNSVLLLPDSLTVFPILLSVYCLARAAKKPRLLTFIAAGALVGISCWLRANAILLAFFLAAAVFRFIRDRKRWRYSLAAVTASILIVMPLTIRNAIVFHRFIPLSLGGGQTLLEGISDYDPAGRFGIPSTDMGIMKQEAEMFQRPDYYETLFQPDGIERDRWRLRRGFGVIRSHPLWFSGVMIRRAGSMVRLERARLISTSPSPTHPLNSPENRQPVWVRTPAQLLAGGTILSQGAKASLTSDNEQIELMGDDSRYERQFVSAPVPVQRDTDCVFTLPVKTEEGRMKIEVTDARGAIYSSAIVETLETKNGEQPVTSVALPFVADDEQVRITFSNEASNPAHPIVQIGTIKLYELGPARFLWTRYLRLLIHGIQKLFLTAVMLPLAIIGLAVLILRRQKLALIILSVVPIYYFSVQSIFHTEYRYVLAVNYFIFAFVGVGLTLIASWITKRIKSLRQAPAQSAH
jgi:hypothetical protein